MSPTIDVLDRGWVQLHNVMGDDAYIPNVARTSFLGDSKGHERDMRLLSYLYDHQHGTPFEFVQFHFRIHAPLVVWWQWMRHRLDSYNLQSGRYVAFQQDDFYLPVEWRKQSQSNKQGSDGLIAESDARALSEQLEQHIRSSYEWYKTALNMGVAKEQARLFLPAFALYYTGMWSVNARSLLNFLRLRLDDHAQHEIRAYAQAIETILSTTLPKTYKKFKESGHAI